MTIPAGDSSVSQHTGNGVADTFDYEFKINDESDLLVTTTDTDGNDTVLTLTTDYTVSGVGDDDGGSITLVAGALTDEYGITIEDNVPLSQLTPFGNQASFYGRLHESALDKVTRLVRRAFNKLDTSMKIPSSVQGVSTELPKPSALNLLRWKSDATGLENVSTDTLAGGLAAEAEGYKNDAETAKSAAEAAQAAAEAVFDAFDDKYLGSKASDPTLDNDGNALADGALYYNTTDNVLKVYDLGTTTWIELPYSELSTLTDVTITSISSGEILKWDGSKWVNQTLNEAGIQPYDPNTVKRDVANVYTAVQTPDSTALSSSSNSVAVDLSADHDFTLDMTENTTLAAPSNVTARQSGCIEITQDASTAYTLAYNTFWKFANGDVPAISDTLSSKNLLIYKVSDDGSYANCALKANVS